MIRRVSCSIVSVPIRIIPCTSPSNAVTLLRQSNIASVLGQGGFLSTQNFSTAAALTLEPLTGALAVFGPLLLVYNSSREAAMSS